MRHNRGCGALRLTRHTWSTQRGVRVSGSPPLHPLPPQPHLSPQPSSPALQHLSIRAVRSLVGRREEGAACIHGLTMIKTHSEEPFKSPVPIIESLIGAYSARKVFSGGEKKSFGEATITLLPCVCKIYAALHPRLFSYSLCCLFSFFTLKSVTAE